jgi:sec-independent protein translocase protein TatB
MFGVDFSELIVIMVIGLIVIGPERLPKVARTLGALWGRAQRYINGVKADLARDMAVDELRQMQQKVQEEADAAAQAVRQSSQAMDQRMRELSDAVVKSAQEIEQKVQSAPSQDPAPSSSPGQPESQLLADHKKFPVD